MTQETGILLQDAEMEELRWAYTNLEHPSLAARLSNLLAEPIEEAIGLLPKSWQKRWNRTLKANTYKTVQLAVVTMNHRSQGPAHDWWHKFAAAGTGAAGGLLGPLSLVAELPFTTLLMLRSIADIARSQGEDLSELEARMACVYTFALGARTKDDEAADVGYYALRTLLGLHFTRDIIEYATSAAGPHIPAFIGLTRAIVARFGVIISDKVALQMVPVAGAVSGAGLNVIFMNHFQHVARGHFIVRRLERKYGDEAIKSEYQKLKLKEVEAERDFSPVEGW